MIWKLACRSENFLRKSLRVRYGPFILQLTPLPLSLLPAHQVRQKFGALVDFVRQSNMVRALQVTCHSDFTNRIPPETTPWEVIGMPYTQSIDTYLLSKYYLKNSLRRNLPQRSHNRHLMNSRFAFLPPWGIAVKHCRIQVVFRDSSLTAVSYDTILFESTWYALISSSKLHWNELSRSQPHFGPEAVSTCWVLLVTSIGCKQPKFSTEILYLQSNNMLV